MSVLHWGLVLHHERDPVGFLKALLTVKQFHLTLLAYFMGSIYRIKFV